MPLSIASTCPSVLANIQLSGTLLRGRYEQHLLLYRGSFWGRSKSVNILVIEADFPAVCTLPLIWMFLVFDILLPVFVGAQATGPGTAKAQTPANKVPTTKAAHLVLTQSLHNR